MTAGSSSAPILSAGGVDRVFALRLPELVHAAEAIVHLEHRCRQILHQALQTVPVLGRHLDAQDRVVLSEDLRQHVGVKCVHRGRHLVSWSREVEA